MFLKFLQLKTYNQNILFYISCTSIPLKVAHWAFELAQTVDKRGPSDRSASLFRLYVSQTTCMWTWNPPFVDVLSTAPLISDLSGQRRVPETSQDAVRFLSGGALLPVLRRQLLNSLVHAALPHPSPTPTLHPPTFGFNTRTLKTQPTAPPAASFPASRPLPVQVVSTRKFSCGLAAPYLRPTLTPHPY